MVGKRLRIRTITGLCIGVPEPCPNTMSAIASSGSTRIVATSGPPEVTTILPSVTVTRANSGHALRSLGYFATTFTSLPGT